MKNANAFPTIAALMCEATERALLTPLIRTIGNIMSGPDNYVTTLLLSTSTPSDLVLALLACLKTEHRSIVKESLWALSTMVRRKQSPRESSLQMIKNLLVIAKSY